MIRQLSATEATICDVNMGEKAYMTECMEQYSGVKPDIDSTYLKKFPKLYVPGRRFYLPYSQQLAAGSYDEPDERSPHLHTPIIRGALIFSFHPIPVVDIPLRHCGQDLYTCLLPSLRILAVHASSITATFI